MMKTRQTVHMRATVIDRIDDVTGTEPHLVQLYRTPRGLARTVATWVFPCLSGGGGAILVGTPAQVDQIRFALGELNVNARDLERAGRLVVVDAAVLLGELQRENLDSAVLSRKMARIVTGIRAACQDTAAPIRGWGEMVNILANRGNTADALELEHAWNVVLAAEQIRLLCSYDVGALTNDAYTGLWADVSATHGIVLCEQYGEPPPHSAPRPDRASAMAVVDSVLGSGCNDGADDERSLRR